MAPLTPGSGYPGTGYPTTPRGWLLFALEGLLMLGHLLLVFAIVFVVLAVVVFVVGRWLLF